MRKNTLILTGIITIALIFRIIYAFNAPLGGDESVSLLQAAGRATEYDQLKPIKVTPIKNLKEIMDYSEGYGFADVVDSMKYGGMHPPLYYLVLHYVMKFLGNDAFVLRMVSVLFSTLSVLMIYVLAKEFLSESGAFFCSLLLAVSSYGSDFGIMIRPYPMVMLLAITSTWLAVRLVNSSRVCFSNGLLWLYIFTAAAGLYSIYNFIFVILFQMVFVSVSYIRNKRNLLTVLLIYAIIAVLYLPWIPGFLEQFKVANSGRYYFHGKAGPLDILQAIITSNFTRSLPGTYSYYKFAIAIFVTVAALIGCVYISRRPKGKYLIIAICSYVLTNYAMDVALGSKTAIVAKLLFLMFPLFIIFLAAGIVHMPNKYKLKGICVTVLVGLFLIHLAATYEHRKRYALEGSYSHKQFQYLINTNISDSDTALILLDSARRRFVLSLIHTIDRDGDVQVMPAGKAETLFENSEDLGKYTKIFIVNHFHPKRDFASEDDIEFVQNTLLQKGFTVGFEEKQSHFKKTLVMLKK